MRASMRPFHWNYFRGFLARRSSPGGTTLKLVHHVKGLQQKLRLIAVSVRNSSRQSMCSTCRVLHEIAKASQAVVEVLLSRLKILCCSPTTIPLGTGPVVGIVRLPLQIDRRTLPPEEPVGKIPYSSIEALTAALHFVLATSLVLLSLCKLVHRPTRLGIEYVTLRVLGLPTHLQT